MDPFDFPLFPFQNMQSGHASFCSAAVTGLFVGAAVTGLLVAATGLLVVVTGLIVVETNVVPNKLSKSGPYILSVEVHESLERTEA